AAVGAWAADVGANCLAGGEPAPLVAEPWGVVVIGWLAPTGAGAWEGGGFVLWLVLGEPAVLGAGPWADGAGWAPGDWAWAWG
ncbi:MAG: hypothetical protein EBU30_12435, partial [Synechococcaceae bacterium WB6_3B_236]|nr:hypothetical protein [Synechococcaceae bacterium WB6_3B_236]